MSTGSPDLQLLSFDRYTNIGDIALRIRILTSKITSYFAGIVLVFASYFLLLQKTGGVSLLLMGLGTALALHIWGKNGLGLPVFPMLVVQHFIVYALPILTQDESISTLYPESLITQAGLEVLIFMLALTFSWLAGMKIFRPSPARAYILVDLVRDGTRNLSFLGFQLLIGTTVFVVLQISHTIDLFLALLPSGSQSIITTLVLAVGSCGFFLVALNLYHSETTRFQRTLYWLILFFNCLISTMSLLLSNAGVFVFSTMIGLIWSSGKLPIKFMAVVLLTLSFLNLGKYEMRERYWGIDGDMVQEIKILELPQFYSQWTLSSFSRLTAPDASSSTFSDLTRKESSLTLAQRINNLQNLLYVIDAVEIHKASLLEGDTYTLIPPLLIPRIFWPEKPRTHEGQVILNVHFGRQDLISTLRTYIAWGLLPEAYGNFGSILGPIFLGVILGVFCSWIENFSVLKPIMSVEGFCAFTVFLGLVASFEMVSSVMVTSIFQGLIPIIAATLPFSRQMSISRPVPDSSSST